MVDPVLNGQINISGTMYGSTVLYQCDTGYRLVGEQLLTCTVSGWSFPEPICIASGNKKIKTICSASGNKKINLYVLHRVTKG